MNETVTNRSAGNAKSPTVLTTPPGSVDSEHHRKESKERSGDEKEEVGRLGVREKGNKREDRSYELWKKEQGDREEQYKEGEQGTGRRNTAQPIAQSARQSRKVSLSASHDGAEPRHLHPLHKNGLVVEIHALEARFEIEVHGEGGRNEIFSVLVNAA